MKLAAGVMVENHEELSNLMRKPEENPEDLRGAGRTSPKSKASEERHSGG